VKQMGARSAGNPHAACDVEGAGDVVWVGTPGPQRRASPRPYRRGGGWKRGMVEIVGHSQTKGRDNREPKLRAKPARQSSTLLIGGIEETSASFEARSAPRSYPTPITRHRATA
jgi:hypothetical protein